MNEVSQLMDHVDPELLSEDGFYQVVLVDQYGSEIENQTPVKLANPFEFDIKRFVPSDGVFDLPRFFELAEELAQDIQSRQGTNEDERVHIRESFNIDEIHVHGDEVISWRVIKREPGKMNTKATGRPQRRGQYSYNLRSALNPNKVIIVDSRPIDHIIEFSCWAKTAPLANKRALWLERAFVDHSWAFMVKGVEKFYWTSRGPDTFQLAGGQRIYQRSLRFFVRLREFHPVAHPALRNLTFEVTLTD